MNGAAWERAKGLLADAAELPVAEREPFITANCNDPDLRRELLELLAAPAPLSEIVGRPALSEGSRLGPYVIERLIGRGGMGEVYEARDTMLQRRVAVKVLPPALAADRDRIARLKREAQLLAALNHPNIAQIHGFDEFDGVPALVMESVAGATLAERLSGHAMAADTALRIARQIADALEAAHHQDIIHRDLKPANIKVTDDGTVKVLDFGLAKGQDALAGSVDETKPGMVVGTASYMAPEQAVGHPVDKRVDIWSFGCVLYEMLAGRRAFDDGDTSATLSRVLAQDPDWTRLPASLPEPIERLLRRCLQKDRAHRLADIADARLDIDDALTPGQATASGGKRNVAGARWRVAVPWIVAAMSLAALAWAMFVRPGSAPAVPDRLPLRSSVDLGSSGVVLDDNLAAGLALSPDGTRLAFVGRLPSETVPVIYVRSLDQWQPSALADTGGAYAPFFSPDGRWIAFFSGGKLKKVSVDGGAAVPLCDAPNGRGGTWGDDGSIVFSPDRLGSLVRVPASGGTASPVAKLEAGEVTQRWPQMLPGSQALLFTSLSPADDFDFGNGNLVFQSTTTGERKVVQRGAYYGRYMPSGHLLFLRERVLLAAPFDAARGELTGTPQTIVTGMLTNRTSGAGLFAMSASGALVYLAVSAAREPSPIHWIDRLGARTLLRSPGAMPGALAFAPDGQRLAMDLFDGKLIDVWIDDLPRAALARATSSATHSTGPVWTPDGRRFAFASQRAERGIHVTFNLYWQRVDGAAPAQKLTSSDAFQLPGSWHPNGKLLAFEEERPPHSALMLLQLEGNETAGWTPGTPTPLFPSTFVQRAPAFSPDGRWLAYESNQSGRFEVYVRAFPGPGQPWRVSTDGGRFPVWSRTRPEILYSTSDQQIIVVPYARVADDLRPGTPRPWPEARHRTGPRRPYDLHPDGNRIALVVPDKPTVGARDQVYLILNFDRELQRIAPSGR